MRVSDFRIEPVDPKHRAVFLVAISVVIAWLFVGCTDQSRGSFAERIDQDSVASFCKVEFDRKQDFGIVPVGVSLDRKVKLFNSSDRPIRVSVQRVTCSCVSVFPEQAIVMPGDTEEIRVSADVYGSTDRQTHGALFRVEPTNGESSWAKSENTSQAFSCMISFVPDVPFEVHPLFLSIVNRSGDEFVRRLVITAARGQSEAIEVKGAACDIDGIDCHVVEGDGDPTVRVIEVRGRLDYMASSMNGQVTVLTASPRFPEVAIPITVSVLPRVSVEPSAIVLNREVNDSQEQFRISVANVTANDLPLTGKFRSLKNQDSPSIVRGSFEGVVGNVVVSTDIGSSGLGYLDIYSAAGELLIDVPVVWMPGQLVTNQD